MEQLGSILARFAKPILAFFMMLFYLVIMKDPFFGDGISTISRASFHILDSNFTQFTYPHGQDPGHPTTFPLFYALIWSIFGKSLIISHLFNALFAVGVLWIVFDWLKSELNAIYALVAALLLSITPLFLAQMAMINTHLPLTFFTLLLAYSLFRHWKYLASIAAALLLLTHLQGLLYLGGVCIWWFFIHLNQRSLAFRIKKSVKLLIIPAALFGGWLYYHYSTTGWLMSTPSTDFYGRGYGGLKISLVNWLVSFWRMADYGQIAYILPLVFLFFKRSLFKHMHTFLWLFLILFLLNGFMLSFTTTLRTAHRYFLPALPFLVMASIYLTAHYGKKWWLVLTCLLVFSGHFWNYPGRTIGDATLSYRNVFPMLEEMNEIVDGDTLYTFSPLSDANEYAYLGKSPVHLNSLYDKNYKEVSYVVRANVSGDFSDEMIADLETNWNSHTLQKGHIYLTLYVNPKTNFPLDVGHLRTESPFEKWFKKMKKKLRNE